MQINTVREAPGFAVARHRSASPSRLTLAYSLPTGFPNKALNRLERLQTPKGVSK